MHNLHVITSSNDAMTHQYDCCLGKKSVRAFMLDFQKLCMPITALISALSG